MKLQIISLTIPKQPRRQTERLKAVKCTSDRQNRLKKPNKAPETVTDSETVRTSADETATSTANQGRRPAEKRPSDTETEPESDTQTEPETVNEFFTVSTLPETETRRPCTDRAVKGVQATCMAIAE